jgi:hypothetical protein
LQKGKYADVSRIGHNQRSKKRDKKQIYTDAMMGVFVTCDVVVLYAHAVAPELKPF